MKKWAAQGSGALAWGLFFSLAPFPSAILCIPAFTWREVVRWRKHGFWPGFLPRMTVITLVVLIAVLLPVKYEDTNRVGPFSTCEVSLSEVHFQSDGRFQFPSERWESRVRMSSVKPTWREAIRSVERDTGLRARVARCGTSATLLWGGYPMHVDFE